MTKKLIWTAVLLSTSVEKDVASAIKKNNTKAGTPIFITDSDQLEKYSWNNSVKLAYGKTKLGKDEAKKAADEIKLESVYTYKMNIHVNPYAAATALTQFTDGFDYNQTPKQKISASMDPGYFTQSVGVGIQVLEQVKTRLGDALKETVAKDFKETYADGEEMRVEYGAESVTDVSWKIAENILFTSKLELFSNLKAINQNGLRI